MFRLLSLGTLLAGVFIGTGNAQSASGNRTWQVFAPISQPPVFYEPSAIAVGTDHHLFVLDAASGNVQILSPTGQVLAQWSSHLTDPTGIAVSRDGFVYLADAGTGRLVRFSRSGEVGWAVQLPHTGRKQFTPGSYPIRPAVTPSGEIYVLYGAGGSVWLSHVSAAGRLLGTRFLLPRNPPPGDICEFAPCTHMETCDPNFAEPHDIGVDGRGTIYTLAGGDCTESRYVMLQMWSPRGMLVHEWKLGRILCTCPFIPVTLAVSRQGAITIAGSGVYLSSNPLGGLSRLSAAGHIVSRRPITTCAGNYPQPSGLTVDGRGTLYLVDRMGRTVQMVAPNLRQRAIWGCPTHPLSQPSHVEVDAADAVYVSDDGHGRMVKLAPDGHELAVWQHVSPLAFSVDSNGDTYLIRYNNGPDTVVDALSPSGHHLWSKSGDYFTSIVADGRGRVYVSARKIGVQVLPYILVYTTTGHLIAKWGGKSLPSSLRSDYPQCMTADVKGNVYCAVGRRVVEVSPDGRALATWSIPYASLSQAAPGGTAYWPQRGQSVAVDRQGNLYVDYFAGVVELSPAGRMLGRWGGMGALPGQFVDAAGLAVDSRGTLYVADSGNNRIQKLSSQ
ncbi:MAG TPA: NHL repeat-containing protein [Chloroflexota bacterium]